MSLGYLFTTNCKKTVARRHEPTKQGALTVIKYDTNRSKKRMKGRFQRSNDMVINAILHLQYNKATCSNH